ncbi:hypothetical protein JR316_0005251 [Psilocybe cubensis]|uniref:Aminoglycoside phosphotransferase domain-containing protein n=2 Tax=Psilocybe cubensis TaxID=181762 RepID=A0A8H8CM58_PSICU|nr:hypothetical protein JR316_0005251 [Psilocybe cubensis]KAH9483148.1 hypothetical protein JR316_0005251 [Psilocybe cubensis]
MATKPGDSNDSKLGSLNFQVPWFPVRELTGFKLFRFELGQRLSWSLPTWRIINFITNKINNNSKKFIKCGPHVRVQEALTMEFIARTTTIPVPRVLDVFSIKENVYIVQERIKGPILEDVWYLLSPDEQRSCMLQIKDCFDQLRSLTPAAGSDSERVQAVDGSGLIDSRVGQGVWGPFENHDEFHRHLNHPILRELHERYPALQEPLAKVAGKKYRSVFSHGDFGPHNLIWVDGKGKGKGKGKIVVIDWERAGWFPEYWDYTRVYAARWYMKEWCDLFSAVVDRYDDELEVQDRIDEYFER